MARIDGLLRLVIQQGADELRLIVEREPKMFARGQPKRLSVPATSEETLRILLGDILSPEVEEKLHAQGYAGTEYEAAGLGLFRVKFKPAETGGFEVAFLHADVHGRAEETSDPEGSVAVAVAVATAVAGAPPARAGSRTLPQGRSIAPPSAAVDSAAASLPNAVAERKRAVPMVERLPAAHQIANAPQAEPAEKQAQTSSNGQRTAATDPQHNGTRTEPDAPASAPHTSATRTAPGVSPTERSVTQHAPSALLELVRNAAVLHASDLHLAEGEPPRVRVDGKLQQLSQMIVGELPKLLGLEGNDHTRLVQSGGVDLALELPKIGRLRVHVYRTDVGYAAALRMLPRAAPSFSELNMPLAFDDLVDLPHGLVLVCGSAGSGKSTTLAALAQELLRRRSVVMVTLEDPIEYTLSASAHSLVRRRQIGRDVRDFPAGLRDALRADPEVLLVGEMRDPESISLALTAAETGHLVMSSLHSGSAMSAIERIIDVYPSAHKEQIRTQLADALRAVIVQRLLPRASGTGRIPAIEVLRVTRAVASLIRDGKTEQLPTVLQSSKREGMLVLERCLADRVQAGEVTLAAANAAANDPDTLATYLGRR
ncbi:MAG TPA: PilT/PilU family type 4a pilus ATPase [Polyangiales bacterium]|nr:PilT/PilU family type 4a pilus ATPase [Polyangiales bacterium]